MAVARINWKSRSLYDRPYYLLLSAWIFLGQLWWLYCANKTFVAPIPHRQLKIRFHERLKKSWAGRGQRRLGAFWEANGLMAICDRPEKRWEATVRLLSQSKKMPVRFAVVSRILSKITKSIVLFLKYNLIFILFLQTGEKFSAIIIWSDKSTHLKRPAVWNRELLTKH